MSRDLDADYDVDDLEDAVDEGDIAERGRRIRVARLQIEDLLRKQMGLDARLQPSDRRTGPNALN